jgi:hypothetical protein
MVSSGVAVPVVKSVADAVAVQEALSRARSSVTVVAPTSPVMVVPGAPEPRSAAVGAAIVSAPLVTAKVTVVFGSPGPGAGAFTAAMLVTAAEAAGIVNPVAKMAAALRLRPTALRIESPP